ncbi:PH domain-containing protein [Puia sp.]|uniref:PH domain-containing protein n=1 Tax=Puia sp. TaxID=2045100 RepID=UPI002F3F13CD
MRTPLQKEEKILLVTHKSWTTLVMPVFVALLGIAVALLIVIKADSAWGWLAAVLGLGYYFFRYLSWKVSIWVVTNFRVIDETGLLSHYAKESPLDKINNVSYDQTPMGRLFNFGHVEIQTAAEVGATDYFDVQHPKRLKDTITTAQADHQTWQYGNQAAQMAAALDARTGPTAKANAPQVAAELEKLFELKMKGAITEEEFLRAKNRLLNP